MCVTDIQKKRVYAAENGAFKGSVVLTWEECQEWFQAVQECPYWASQKGWKRVKLLKGKGGGSYYRANQRSVRLGRDHYTPWVIIHELAHCLTDKTHGWTVAGHGKFFCQHYLGLVECVLGREDATRLQAAFAQLGVNY